MWLAHTLLPTYSHLLVYSLLNRVALQWVKLRGFEEDSVRP